MHGRPDDRRRRSTAHQITRPSKHPTTHFYVATFLSPKPQFQNSNGVKTSSLGLVVDTVIYQWSLRYYHYYPSLILTIIYQHGHHHHLRHHHYLYHHGHHLHYHHIFITIVLIISIIVITTSKVMYCLHVARQQVSTYVVVFC